MSRPPAKPARARPKPHALLFRYSAWDAVPAALAYIHLGLLLALFLAWPHLTWPERVGGAVAYSLAIGWSLDSVSHNFIHNPFFAWEPLNRLTSLVLTLSLGTPQTMYKYVHMRHHAGNSDRIGADGTTVDPISLYQHGGDGKVEPPVSYVLKQFWRDDGPFTVARAIRAKRPREAQQALQEFWAIVGVYGVLLVLNWRFILLMAPFYYLGHCFSFLIAWYEHAGADPDQPIATGVSTYEPVYNWAFLNNGYHAEHHYQPKTHWSAMKGLSAETRALREAAPVRTLSVAHFLGWADNKAAKVPVANARHAPTAG
ncbi:fatty acid desaturase [Phenylobacterium sp.]|jgi:fatty acid desaturase|uniref:fatty acid desaturase n=1 Tax=Phenylobacterium sp. TaxID=1871053 RepID=UPI002E3441B2|nr:fatty acid desaturase [Phenylobacterium sp.]HEX3363727.1 fatty acid desaturase [Phenylobacterium sp.]